jgi:hypothetical protein
MTTYYPFPPGENATAGAGDGTNLLIEITPDTVPELVEIPVYEAFGDATVARYALTGAKDGDELMVTAHVDEAIAMEYSLVLPAEFTKGVISIKNTAPFSVWLVTADRADGPYVDNSFNVLPGAVQVMPDVLMQFLVQTSVVDGETITQLSSLGSRVFAIELKEKDLTAPSVGTLFEFTVPGSASGNKLMPFNPPTAITTFSDVDVSLKFEVFEWNAGTRAFDLSAAEYTFDNTSTGDVNYGSILPVTSLPSVNIGGFTYRKLPDAGSLVRISLTSGTPAFINLAVALQTNITL